jgi:hypothetical protein
MPYKLVQTDFTSLLKAPVGVVVEATRAIPRDLASLAQEAGAVPDVKTVSTFEHLGAPSGCPTWPWARRPCRRRAADGESSPVVARPGPVTVVG